MIVTLRVTVRKKALYISFFRKKVSIDIQNAQYIDSKFTTFMTELNI
jgi:hypothetical protein